jgi:gamma-glutamylcyclotransferase (GGCT)/AIG2-like uncharacterized protein YtfP
MRGESRFDILRGFEPTCILLAECAGRLIDQGEYPAMLDPVLAGQVVRGEFIRLGEIGRAIERLDGIEGFKGFGQEGSRFRRAPRWVDVGDRRLRRAWTYLLAGSPLEGRPIDSGDWRKHRGTSQEFLMRLAAAHSRGDDAATARRIIETRRFRPFPDLEKVVQQLSALWKAIESGDVSERILAQASGLWNALA